MNGNSNGTNPFEGVNPATGAVLYYTLPELMENEHISLEIKDASGKMVRSFTSKPDSAYEWYPGGPDAEPLLPKAKGLNRFVWDLRFPTLPGAPTAYVEGSFRGHRAITGKYTATLLVGDKAETKQFSILSNPLYKQNPANEKIYDETLTRMEATFREMHNMINSLQRRRKQVDALISKLPPENRFDTLRKEARALSDSLKAWDEEMIQRKSKAYDDVENFPNRFNADYLFMMNQTDNDIYLITQPTLDLEKELNKKWVTLKQRANKMLEIDIPALNKKLYEQGIGALWMH